jgi:DNA helicase II / ATP-dependent DNA helicase PcrA
MNIEDANPAQREAITTDAASVLVLAGPGSGKTATTIERIRRLISDGVNPDEIVALTFTNAAARETEKRLTPPEPESIKAIKMVLGAESMPASVIRLGHCGTLHSFCLRLLREQGGYMGYGDRLSVISPESAADLLASKAATLGVKTPLKELLALKAKGRPPRGVRIDPAKTAIAAYFDELKENGVVDFDVILSEGLELIRSAPSIVNRWRYLFVDERQDSTDQDNAIYEALPIPNKFLVGDPDQAIYSFRGGNVNAIVDTARDAGTRVIKLESNYRSRDEICHVAQSLIEHNRNRVAKKTRSEQGPGGVIEVIPCETEGDEIGMLARRIRTILTFNPPEKANEIAVLARTNAIATSIRKTLAATGLPVVQCEVSDLPRDWPFTRALVELLANPENDALAFFYLVALYRKKGAPEKDAREAAHAVRKAASAVGKTINAANLHIEPGAWATDAVEHARKFGVSAESAMLLAEKLKELPFGARAIDLALVIAETKDSVKEAGQGVTVTTIHGAKGREWDCVFLAGFEDEIIPSHRKIADQDKAHAAVEEERRLAFVAITRARNTLIISHSASRITPWGQIQRHYPSRFLAEMMGGAR